MSRKKRYKSTQLQREIWKEMGGMCEICGKPAGKGFVVHHKWYLDEKEVKYTDFKTPKAYWEALLRAIMTNQNRFCLLCRNHHHLVEWVAKLNDNSMDMLEAIREEMRSLHPHDPTAAREDMYPDDQMRAWLMALDVHGFGHLWEGWPLGSEYQIVQ